MMRKNIKKIALATVLVASSLSAGEYDFNTHSLFAIEGGYSTLNADVNNAGYSIQKSEMADIGLKLGAEGDNYRVFLSGRYYNAENDNIVATAGGEVQYMFNFSKPVNFFIGANAGASYVKIGPSSDGVLPSASITTPYYGGDMGFNYHATPLMDLELGVRHMHMNGTMTSGASTYDISGITSAYASVIIKWKMD